MKTRHKSSHLKSLHVSKEVPARHHHGEASETFMDISSWGISLKSLHVNTCSLEDKQEELEVCVILQKW